MLANVFDNWLEVYFLCLVSSIQVSRLAYVLIGSLAKLLSSFCKQSVLAPHRWLMLSLARWSHQWLLFGFKSPLRYLTLSWFSTKNEVMLWLTILSVLNHIRFWIEPLPYRVCPTRPLQVLDRTFCYQSLAVLNCIRFWIEPLLLESCRTQQHQVLSRTFCYRSSVRSSAPPLAYASGWSHLTYFRTVKPAYLSKETAWVCLWEQRLGVCYDHGLT